MASPTGEWTRKTLRELVTAWHDDVGTIAMGAREHQLIGLTVYGLTAHTHALAAAVLALDEADLEAGIVPLVRQAVECAMTAVWLELAGYPAVLTVIQEQTRQQRNLIAEFVKSGQVPNDEATARLAADLQAGLASTSQAGARFEARCAEISGGTSAYAIYRALSATSHASASVVDLYLASTQVDETTNPHGAALRLDPRAENRDANLGIMLSMLVAAGSAWSRLDRHRYNRTRLKALCRDLNVAFKHELTARGLAQSRVRGQEYRRWRSRT
jgi:hypothetical protein